MTAIGDDLNKVPAGDQKWDEKDGDIITVKRSAANLPQTTQAALFNVIGGRIELIDIMGEVSTVIQNQANNTKIVANPTSGSDTDLCANLNIANDAVGTRYSITGTFANAMVDTAAGVAVAQQATVVTVEVGTIDLACAASNTGQCTWVLRYRKIDPEAYVTAA